MSDNLSESENYIKKLETTERPGSWRRDQLGRDPFLGLETIRNTMNEMIAEIFYRAGKQPFEVPWQPEINMYSEGNNLVVEMSLPGAIKEDVSIHVTSDLLVVSGSLKESEQAEGRKHFIRERRMGNFSRSIPLPFHVLTDQVKAQLREGLLIITIPIKPEKKTVRTKVEIE